MASLEIKAPTIPGGRIGAIDELKGAAILLILVYHAGGVLVWQNFVHGDVGVDLFVILSGFGLALSSRTEAARSFLQRRFLSIYPTYWIVLAAYLLANTHFLQLHYSALDVVAHFLGIQAWFGDQVGLGVNDSFWFITLIVSLYLVYVLVRPVVRRTDVLVLWCGLISVAVAFGYFFTGQSGCFGHIALRVPGFFMGLLLGVLLRDGRLEVPLSTALATGLILLFYVPYTQGIIFYSELTALAIATAYIFLWKAKAPTSLVAPAGRVLQFFGTYSLEIFLIHQPLLRNYNYYVLGRFFGRPTPTPEALIAGMAVALGVTLVLSVELHKLVARFNRRTGPAPVAA